MFGTVHPRGCRAFVILEYYDVVHVGSVLVPIMSVILWLASMGIQLLELCIVHGRIAYN